jgi:hypothetical protein
MKKILYLIAIQFLCFGNSFAQLQKISANKIRRFGDRNTDAERKALLKKNSTNEVWFYEHANYQGKKYILSKGRFDIATLGVNDFFSSAVIPKQLMVKVFLDDALWGYWILLKADELGQGFNMDFSNLENYQCGQTEKGLALEKGLNINDMISSIEIFDPSEDYITLYDDCNYKNNPLRLVGAPVPIPNSPSMNNFKNNGWNLLWFDPNKKAKKSSIAFHGNIASVDIGLRENMDKVKRNVMHDLDCLAKIEYIYELSVVEKVTYNDNLRWVRINLKYGVKTIED